MSDTAEWTEDDQAYADFISKPEFALPPPQRAHAEEELWWQSVRRWRRESRNPKDSPNG